MFVPGEGPKGQGEPAPEPRRALRSALQRQRQTRQVPVLPLLLAAAARLLNIVGCLLLRRSRIFALGQTWAAAVLAAALCLSLPFPTAAGLGQAPSLPEPFSWPVRWKLTCVVGVIGGLTVVLAIKEFC